MQVVVVVVVVVVIEALQYVFILWKILCGLFFLQELPVRKLGFIVVVIVVVNLISHAGYLFLPSVLEILWNLSETAIFLALDRIRRSLHSHVLFA